MSHPLLTVRQFIRRFFISLLHLSAPVIILLAVWTGTAPAVQQESIAQQESLDSLHRSVRDLIDQGNVFASKYFDNRTALAFYTRALEYERGNSDLLWHISQAYVDIGEHLPSTTEDEQLRKLAAYEKAFEFADQSVAANSSSSMAYARRAVALSRVSLFKGFWETVGLLKSVREDLERAIQLDSTNHLAFYCLGRTHMRVLERAWIFRWPLGLGWGSSTAALQSFETAVRLRGDLIEYRIEYARALIEEGEYEQARSQLELIPSLPTQDEDDDRYRQDARELLDSIKEEE